MVLIICREKKLNLIYTYLDMAPDRQKSVDGKEGMDGGMAQKF